jgi:fucose 4-O-acetylase-like acetyltransferase
VNGVHIFGVPQPWLFPIFPWAAFAFAGMAAGFLLWSDWTRENEPRTMLIVGASGVGLFFICSWLDASPVHLYAVYDYWHTSPNFFLARVGILLVIVLAAYVWCRWGAGQIGFSPLIQMGKTSLLVYWVHIEFVYGRFSILTKRAQTVPMATLGLMVIFVAMVLLSMARTWWKGHGGEVLARFRGGRSAAAAG